MCRCRLNEIGRKYYEFRRARFRIEQDANYKDAKPSDGESKRAIEGDLQSAFSHKGNWQRWIEDDEAARKWIKSICSGSRASVRGTAAIGRKLPLTSLSCLHRADLEPVR